MAKNIDTIVKKIRKTITWADVKEVEVEDGTLSVTLNAAAIFTDQLFLLCKALGTYCILVGVDKGFVSLNIDVA